MTAFGGGRVKTSFWPAGDDDFNGQDKAIVRGAHSICCWDRLACPSRQARIASISGLTPIIAITRLML